MNGLREKGTRIKQLFRYFFCKTEQKKGSNSWWGNYNFLKIGEIIAYLYADRNDIVQKIIIIIKIEEEIAEIITLNMREKMGSNAQGQRLTSNKSRNGFFSEKEKKNIEHRFKWVGGYRVEICRTALPIAFIFSIDSTLPIRHCARPYGHKDKKSIVPALRIFLVWVTE